MIQLLLGHQGSAPSCALHADLLGRHALPAVPEAALRLQSLKSPWGALGPAPVVPNTSQRTPMLKLVCHQRSQLPGSFPPAASSGSSAGHSPACLCARHTSCEANIAGHVVSIQPTFHRTSVSNAIQSQRRSAL